MFTIEKVISYWRDSLTDSELTTLELSDTNHVRVRFDALKTGQLPETLTEVLFAGVRPPSNSTADEKQDYTNISVIVAPIVLTKDGHSRYSDTITFVRC